MNESKSRNFRIKKKSPGFLGIAGKRCVSAEDGFSIGSNDLAQLTLGLDRDSGDWLGSTGVPWKP
jgi:phosphoenolpyruvate synthase/pyruvate phosphate dikinase